MMSSLNPDPGIIPDLIKLAKKYLPIHIEQEQSTNWGEVEKRLAVYFRQMMLDQFDQLVQLMYRIDVPEAAFHHAMKMENPEHELTYLVLKRLHQKARTRKIYREYEESQNEKEDS